MPNYITASRTKDYFQTQLLRDHPEIVVISPRLKLDDSGYPTEEGIIVICVAMRPPLRQNLGRSIASPRPSIPSTLPAVNQQGDFIAGEEVQVVVEETDELRADQFNNARIRPCPGGFSVGRINQGGTFGGNVRLGSNFGYILGSNHVLANLNAAAIRDLIIQPASADGGTTQNDTIAQLIRWVPIDFNGNNEVDCAIAQANNPADLQRNVWQIGIPQAMSNATVGQAIRKSGRTTQLTTGSILSENATITPRFGTQTTTFVNQLEYTKMTAPGDSGSLIWDAHSLTVVGLHMAGEGTDYSYGNKILRVIELLSRAFTVDFLGIETHFQKVDISLLDVPNPNRSQNFR
jgi:Trypsin